MYLIYTDETGTNFSPKESQFLLYGGLLVHESKVNNLELQLQNMIAKFLHLDDIKKVELHTSEIFQILFSDDFDCSKKRKQSKVKLCEKLTKVLEKVTQNDFILFADELIQFLIKMDIRLMVSIVNKNDEKHKEHFLGKEVSALAYSFKMFLNLIDRFLAKRNENGLLIADDFHNQIPAKIRNLPLYERIADENLKNHKELVFLRVLHRSLDWKTNHTDLKDLAPLKYEFESKNMFLVDNINYTNSKDSILNQVADFLLFIIRKILEHNSNTVDDENKKSMKTTDLVNKIEKSIKFAETSEIIQIAIMEKDDISIIRGLYDKLIKRV
jgi:hypothetical protein